MNATVTRQELLTAMLFASTDESRYVLNGVLIISQKDKAPIVVSTDGRRMCVIETTAQQDNGAARDEGEIVLRAEFLKAITSLSKAIGGKLFPWISFAKKEGSERLEIAIVGGNCFLESEKGALIEADYPNWRQVIPPKRAKRDPVSEIGLNAEYVGDYAKAAKVLECETPVVQMNVVGKESAIEIKLVGRPNFYGLVMQTKLDEGAEYQPEFLSITKDFPKPEEKTEEAPVEFDADGDRLSQPIQSAMATIGNAIAKAKK